MTHDEVIRALGGPRAVARAVGVDVSAPYRWPERGIPLRHWPAIIEMARERGVNGVTADSLLCGQPREAA
jgi:hypothetical protein